MADRSELTKGEFHPAVENALRYIKGIPASELTIWLGSFSSCAIEGNRLAEVCAGTLDRMMSGQSVGERYVLGLAFTIQNMERIKSDA